MSMVVALFVWLYGYEYLGLTKRLLMNFDNNSFYVEFRVNTTTEHIMNFQTLESSTVLKR